MMWFGGAGWAMGLAMVLFWVGVVLLVVWAARGFGERGIPESRSRALAILEERFARGEIDRDELEARRSAIEGR